MLIPALPFAAPSSEVSLARIWGLGARQAGKSTVVASIVRPLQGSADDGADRYGQTSVLVGYRSGAKGRWIQAYGASQLDYVTRGRCAGCGDDDCRNVSSVGQSEIVMLGPPNSSPNISLLCSRFEVSAEETGQCAIVVASALLVASSIVVAPAISTPIHPTMNSTVMPIIGLGLIDTQLYTARRSLR